MRCDHNIGCIVDYPGCPCTTCRRDRDEWGEGLCCLEHGIDCEHPRECPDYEKEGEEE